MLSFDIYVLNLLEQTIMHLSIFKAVETEFICRLNSSCSEFLSIVWRVKTFLPPVFKKALHIILSENKQLKSIVLYYDYGNLWLHSI